MRIIFFILMIGLGPMASGTTYYVSSSSGSDANSGTSSANAWKTMAKVNGSTFAAGDSILLKRGDVWNESLVPPSSGASGNPITFDAYGTGAAPNLTGYYAVPSSAWVNVTGNAWKAALTPATGTYSTISFCLFGSVWGQKVSFGTGNLTAKWDFYLSGTYVYVYSVGNPSTYYAGGPIVPMALSDVPVININGQSWLTFQHLLVNWFDDYGVYVQGTSDHLVFANMEADSMIPEGTQPLGFYVNESTPGPGDIKIYNAEAHMNYDGFRFDGAATAITMVNDKAYANRDGALVDNTGSVTYSYCHFYASSLAVAGSTDVLETVGSGPTAGAGNIAADIPPAVQAWQRYPGRVTLTVDDIGMTPGADTYYASTVLPIADAAAVPVGVAITVGYTSTITPLISEIQGWINAGRDVASHSISHTYYTNTDALDIQYTGSGTAATLTISGQVLTIAVTGAADSVSYNLARGDTQGTILNLYTALNATGKFTATLSPLPCQGPYGTGCSVYTAAALLSQDLAEVSGQDVKSGVYHAQLDVTRLTTDEITLSRSWMTSNLTGLPTTPVYIYPGGYEDPNMEAIAAGVPYVGGRGALHEGGTSNLGAPITGVKDTYASGFDVQDITSFGVNPSWMGLTPTSLQQKVQALVWKEMVWGVPWGIFWHYNATTMSGELSGTEVTNLIADLQGAGATMQTNTGLVNWLLTGTLESGNDGNFYYKSAATSAYSANGGLDFRPTAGSPVVDAGENLGTAYELDINGINQNSYGTGWEIGAHVFAGFATYGEGGTSSTYFSIGEGLTSFLCGPPTYACALNSTESEGQAVIQNVTPTPNMGNLTGAGTVVTPADFNLPICRLTDATFDPSVPNNTIVTNSGGSGDETLFNTNSTLLIVGRGGEGYPMSLSFNGATCTPGRLYASNPSWSARGGWYLPSDDPGWSYANPYLLFLFDGTNPAIDSYNVSGYSPTGTPPANVVVYDFRAGQTGAWGTTSSNALPSNYAMTWSSFGKQNKATLSLAADQVFGAGVSNAVQILGAVGASSSNTVSNLDDTLTGWNYCWSGGTGGNLCTPGGSGTVTSGPSVTINNPSPSEDGESMLFGFTGTAYTDVLNYYQAGAQDSATSFTADFYVQDSGPIQAAEFDVYQYLHATLDLINWGTQCNTGGYWQVWEGDTSAWHNTSVSCSSLGSSMHHIVIAVHRLPGDMSCSGHPRMYYDTLTIDGTPNSLGTSYCSTALPSNYSDQTGLNFQLDTNASGGAVSEYTDEVKLTAATTSFVNGETIAQEGTGATATLHFVHTNLYVDTVTGSPNSSGTWVGQTSGATFIPTAVPGPAGQNYGTDVVAYKVGSGVSYLNTLTGVVSGDWGSTGTVGIGDRFTIHNAKISKDGNWMLIAFEFCLTTCTNNVNTPYMWQIGTTNLYPGCVPSNDCGGHFTEGYSHFINDDGSPTLQQISRLYGNNSTPAVIPQGLPWSGSTCTGTNVVDTHQNWTNADILDSYPVFQTTFLATPSTAANPYVCAGADEVQGINPTTGTVYRFAHTYNSDQNENFSTAETIGAVSQDGNYAMWSSDWEGTLGSTSGGSTCSLTTTCRGDVFVVALDGGQTLGNSPMFGFTETGTGSGNFPTVSYGMQRIWDSPPLQWPSIETAANTFTFTNLDAMLAQDYSNGVTDAMYTLARTPPWITSQPTDTTCNYQAPATGGGNGECFAPSDLNADGSGTNATWKAWITKIAQHANGQDGNAGYLMNHAHIRYWEIWNEPDAAAYWSGSFAQLARLPEDANCIITGRGVIHPNGNGSAVACTATAIDPTARIVMSSGHATSAAVLTYAQNQLYCNNTAGIPSYELPCPNPANAIAAVVDIVNYHLKPGNTTGNNCPAPTPCTPETAMTTYMSSIRGTLQAAELAKPIWDGEMSYATAGFTTPYSDPDMAASFLPRMYLMMWSLGISGSAFYTWDSLRAEPAQVQTAYQQTYGWLAGAMLTSPCSSSGTVYQCGIVKYGVPYSIIWDSSQSCSGGSCSTSNQAVGSEWGHYQDMTTGSTPAAVAGSTVAVGIKPVVLSR